MPNESPRSITSCETHGMERFRKVHKKAAKDGLAINLGRAVTLAAYLLDDLSTEQLRALNKRVPTTRKTVGRPPAVK